MCRLVEREVKSLYPGTRFSTSNIVKEGLFNLESENQRIGDERGLFQDCENCLYRGKAIILLQTNFQNVVVVVFVVVVYPLSTMFYRQECRVLK